MDDAHWERIASKDSGAEVVYYKTKNAISPAVDESGIALDTIQCESKLVSNATTRPQLTLAQHIPCM